MKTELLIQALKAVKEQIEGINPDVVLFNSENNVVRKGTEDKYVQTETILRQEVLDMISDTSHRQTKATTWIDAVLDTLEGQDEA